MKGEGKEDGTLVIRRKELVFYRGVLEKGWVWAEGEDISRKRD